MSPTITSPAMVTGVGMLLGTAAYMSPEQARGKTADKRADIWAFGCVLFEMLSGRRAFDGEDTSDTLAAVLRGEPDWSALPDNVPTAVRVVLRSCLEKDRRKRVADVDVALFVLDHYPQLLSDSQSPPRVRRRLLLPLATLVLGSVVSGFLVWSGTRMNVPTPRVSRLQMTPNGADALATSGFDNDIAITPDGSRVVYIGNYGTQLFVRSLDSLESVALAKGEFRMPFVSPDGQWVGFLADGQAIRKVALTGGPAVPVFTVSGGVRGASWMPDNALIFATGNSGIGLQRLPPSGGTPTVLTRPDRAHGELNHWWPEILPGGRGVLFTIVPEKGGPDGAQIAVLDLRTGASKVLVRGGTHARYVPTGHLLFGAGGTLRAVRFDLDQLAVVGAPVSVVPNVLSTAFGAVNAAVSSDGTLIYVTGGLKGSLRTLVWVDRQGRKTPLALPERTYGYPRLSPDGTRIVVTSPEQDYDLWLWDIQRATVTRATFDPGQDSFPVWMPDGRRLIFTSASKGPQHVFRKAADGTGAAEQLTEGTTSQNPLSISPDGARLVFVQNDATTGFDLLSLRLDGSRRVEPLVHTPANERNGEISPDGRWLVYQSDESGQYEIYVRPFPAVDSGRWQISTGGGTRPLWSRRSSELFYLTPASALMRVVVERGATWRASAPATLLPKSPAVTPIFSARTYDISGDDQRFLMVDTSAGNDAAADAASLVVVQHWSEELRRVVPDTE